MSVRWQTRERLVHEVVLLARQKVGQRAIARAVGVSRNTVKKILDVHIEQREQGHAALAAPPARLPRSSKLDPFKPRVTGLIKEYPDITAQRVLEILSGEGFRGGYTAVKKYVRNVRPKPAPKPCLTGPPKPRPKPVPRPCLTMPAPRPRPKPKTSPKKPEPRPCLSPPKP